ncbi:MAG: hypothetical protein M0Q94_08050 [Candidatus Cloacimonetes bacterium]|nr:hypothetical protein [Candidatus Cloacimonadota bacterium]
MYEINDDQCLFSSSISVNYDKCFIPIAQNFVEGVCKLAGANGKECSQIILLLEECLVYVINKFIDSKMLAHINILVKVIEDKGIYFEIIDIGPPVHESLIPTFDFLDEKSEDGLWYKLVKELSDDFSFVNQFNSGWLIKIYKKIEIINFKKSLLPDVYNREQTQGKKTIRSATDKDIPEIINLVYMTYRYTYWFRDLYDIDSLKLLMEQKVYDITVIDHGDKVIGAFILKYPYDNKLSAELGSAMILPEYRSSTAGMLLMKSVDEYLKSNPYNCDYFMASAVTSHIISQKMLSRVYNGFKPWLIFVNMMPNANFIGISTENEYRESGLYTYHLNRNMDVQYMYLTSEKHKSIISDILENAKCDINIVVEYGDLPEVETELNCEFNKSLQNATISINKLGNDWYSILMNRIFTAMISGIESILLTIPTVQAFSEDMEQKLIELNFIFCGILPRTKNNLDIAYFFSTKDVGFSNVKLYDPIAKNLLYHIECMYNERVNTKLTFLK